jgi:threonyl-tRNA synthetase
VGRFIAVLLENTGGALPVWLSPIQAIILPVSDKHIKYAQKIANELKDIRSEIDQRNESVSKKIRDAEIQKIPYIIVVGDKEEKEKNITVRTRGSKELKQEKITEFLNNLKKI